MPVADRVKVLMWKNAYLHKKGIDYFRPIGTPPGSVHSSREALEFFWIHTYSHVCHDAAPLMGLAMSGPAMMAARIKGHF
ncbi:hypothetical protein RB195_009195 [Necator americanus]|uniref:Uncharacterized protein n=1 Tax=Necator americanus TaxID=51031 RepID=A0ABR1CVM9_NECAM